MKTLKTLVKIHKQKLDGFRRSLVSLESQKAQLQALHRNLEHELASELKLADQSAELSGLFGNYIKRVRERQERVLREIAEIDVKIDATRGAIRIEYGEQLKYEQMLERKMLEQKKAREHKEALMLDDIAATQHSRREDVESGR